MKEHDLITLARECGIGVHTSQAIASKEELLAFADALIERCAITSWSAAMEEHTRLRGTLTDALTVGSKSAQAVRARKRHHVPVL